MQTVAERARHEPVASAGRRESAIHLAFLALSIFLSAFLLFEVQPLISRWILPWFGGSTAVWTTCMLFFQLVLFAGYAYAHLLFRWLNSRRQRLLHMVILATACAVLPIIPTESWKPHSSAHPGLTILALLGATVGLPYFVLSSTGPLLQSWFARSFPDRSPYRLYALSNVGSLLALLSYPIAVEPLLDLRTQAWIWSGGFVLLALAIGVCAWKQSHGPPLETPDVGSDSELAVSPGSLIAPAPSLLVRSLWVCLPALASVVLLASTNHICQNVAVVPFLWVAPLSLYLVTFIVCFDSAHRYQRAPVAIVTGVLAFCSAGAYHIDFVYDLPLIPELGLYLATMFGACLMCHGELVRLRPRSQHLTEFYLAMSAGGALGGVLVSFVAPCIFKSFFEWNVSLLSVLGVAIGVLLHELGRRHSDRSSRPTDDRSPTLLRHGVLIVGGVSLYYATSWQTSAADVLERSRNFYGVITVHEIDPEDPQLHRYTFRSGRVDHGQQFRAAEKREIPLTYYGRDSGVGRALVDAGRQGPVRVGIVGLGTGTLATFARPGDHYRFYEINPAAIAVAHKRFTYLDDCRGTVDVAEGDARLLIEREQEARFDVLVLDAFSGDTVPVHLLTEEAFQIYERRIRDGGVIAVNVTNHFLRLAAEVERQADARGLGHTRLYQPETEEPGQHRSDWVLMTSDRSFLNRFPSEVPTDVATEEAQASAAPLWTDRFSNLIGLLKNW
jgi:SAM-dependent methyltransferase